MLYFLTFFLFSLYYLYGLFKDSISLFQTHIKVSFYQNSYTIKVLKLNAAF